jgi:4-hydroxy-2-oxoheptanedioate aldolase
VGTVREAGSPAYVKALDDIVVVLMIEERQCVEDLDAILSVKGIDMVRFGPADYAMSIGLAGQWSHPDVVKAERLTIETALRKRIHPRCRDRRFGTGRALSGDGREALLPWLGRGYPA